MGGGEVGGVGGGREQHFQIASDFLEAGVSVLIEKPIAPTLDEARELFAIARRNDAVLHVGHVERFNGAVQELKKIVDIEMARIIEAGELHKLYEKWFQRAIPPKAVNLAMPMSVLLRESLRFPSDKVAD